MPIGNEEADILRITEDENADHYETVAGSFLVKVTCVDCRNADCYVIPSKTASARCIECRRMRLEITAVWGEPFGEWHPTVGYPVIRKDLPEAERPEHPAPLVSSRDHVLSEVIPAPVTELLSFAEEHGWQTRIQHAKGNRVNGSTGRPTALVPSFAVRIGDHPNGLGARAFAVYSGGTTWSWVSVWLFGPALKPFGHCNITDLKQWLAQGASVQQSWYRDVVERVEGQERRRKQREACNRGKHADTVESAGRDVKGKPIRILTCTFCDNAWKVGDQPWRKPKKAKEHA